MFAANFYGDSIGNVTATYINATANIRTTGNVFAANFYGDSIGNVTATYVNATANIKTNGNVIVGGVLSMGTRLQNNMITLYGNTNSAASDFFGFGVNTSTLRYQANSSTSRHKFWVGTAQTATIGLQGSGPCIRLHPPTPSTQQTTFWYNDGTSAYFLNTTAGDPDGGFTTVRPFYYNLSTGNAGFGGDTSLNGNVNIASGKVLYFGSSQNNIICLYPSSTDPTSTEIYGFGVINGNTLMHRAGTAGYHYFYSGGNNTAFLDYNGSGGWNTTASMLYISKNASGTNRSINAAGTVNASGADYAEYMTKADDFEIAKGAIVGINSHGLVTNRFADSVTFAVKSTDPSFVGGDSWGFDETIGTVKPENVSTEQGPEETTDEYSKRMAAILMWKACLEDARARVDRIAFSGQVPCNVLGATPGQYVIPCDPGDGSIAGRAVTRPSHADYMNSVGKVIRILDDGNALVIVKIC